MNSGRMLASNQINVGCGMPLIMQQIRCLPIFRRRKEVVFKVLKALLEPFNISRYYTNDWGAYERHLTPEKHEVGKTNRQNIEGKNLNFGTWIKCLTR